jgi:hypothetical protein
MTTLTNLRLTVVYDAPPLVIVEDIETHYRYTWPDGRAWQ